MGSMQIGEGVSQKKTKARPGPPGISVIEARGAHCAGFPELGEAPMVALMTAPRVEK